VRRFNRSAPPPFWRSKVLAWWTKLASRAHPAPQEVLHRWGHQGQTLAHWFHQEVREEDEPPLCAYCDGRLGTESPATIDHFVPVSHAPHLALEWCNLFPACVVCNSTFKGPKLPWRVAIPDRDPVDQWFECDPETGKLRARPECSLVIRHKVRRTVLLFGLNAPERCQARMRIWKEIRNCDRTGDSDGIQSARTQGPYRFIVEAYVASQQIPASIWRATSPDSKNA
jgi:uncharacterized protein (TIGR02646 family)